MKKANRNSLSKNIGGFQRLLVTFWTIALLVSIAWNIQSKRHEAIEIAKSHARAFFQKDVLARRWNALYGPVYLPISKETPPNPYLANVPERDIITPSGRQLTLINPAYMARQLHELAAGTGSAGHITSLKPIRPGNMPDEWEAQALRLFEQGEQEVTSLTERNGETYLRLMRPLLTEGTCLKCHAQQGYQEGMVRGGISVEVPVSIAPNFWIGNLSILIGHFLLWGCGLLGILVTGRKLRVAVQFRLQAEQELAETNKNLEIMVAERTRELQESRERFRSLIMQMPNGFALHEIIYDQTGKPRDYRFLQVNHSFEKTIGMLEQDIIGKNVLELLPNTDQREIEIYAEVAQTGTPLHHELYSRQLQRYLDIHAFSTTPGEFAIIFSDITARKEAEAEREKLLVELESSLAQVKKLSGMLPICANCKKIRDDQGYWKQVEIYIMDHAEVDFSHGICPECAHKLYPEFYPEPGMDKT